MKRILIVYATAGVGHKKAAIAIKKAFDEMAPGDVEVTLIDSLDYTNAFFRWIYLESYLLLINKLPVVWGLAYYITDNFLVNLVISRLRRFSNWLNSKRLAEYLGRLKPDVVISTHFFASEVISDLKRNGFLKSHLITVITDYRLHLWWVSDFVDTYVVGSEEAKQDLLHRDIPPGKIHILGIPVEPVFSKGLNKSDVLQRTGLKPGVFTILAIGGGFGVGPIEEIVKTIHEIPKTIQTIAICGKNPKLVERLNGLKKELNMDVKVLGFVDNVYDYMEVSNLLISKSGGITVSESLAKELPMVVISPIIGQETRNSDFIISNKAAVKTGDLSGLKTLLEDLIANTEKIERMKEAIRGIRRPAACYDIARLAVKICNDRKA